MEIFPYILLRIGGGPYEVIPSLKTDNLKLISNELAKLQATKEHLKLQLSENIFNLISSTTDIRVQNILQNVRRDIYNDRKITEKSKEKFIHNLSSSLLTEWNEYSNCLSLIESTKIEINYIYEQELVFIRKKLQILSLDENLIKGLILSSHNLIESIKKYQVLDVKLLKKRDINTEFSLLKYLTRMYTKTSPFSTFNSLLIADVVDNLPSPFFLNDSNNLSKKDHHIRLNNSLFKYLRILFNENRDIYIQLKLRLNPTIRIANFNYTYLTNHENIEAFQKMPSNEVLNLVFDIMKSNVESVKFKDLVLYILEYVEELEQDLEKFIKSLLSYGFLEYDYEVSGIDPDWNVNLVNLLKSEFEKNLTTNSIINGISKMNTLAETYASADSKQRLELILEAYSIFKNMCFSLHEKAGLPNIERDNWQSYTLSKMVVKPQDTVLGNSKIAKITPDKSLEKLEFIHLSASAFTFKPEQIFYEDTTSKIHISLDKSDYSNIVNSINSLLNSLRIFESTLDVKNDLIALFKSQLPDRSEISLLDFYELYSRNLLATTNGNLKNEINSNSTQENIKSGLPLYIQFRREKIDKINQALDKLFSEVKFKDNIVYLKSEDLKDVIDQANVSENNKSNKNSYGMFMQFYSEKNKSGKFIIKGVVNSIFPGYGRMMSRFLHTFPQELTDEVRRFNTNQIPDDVIFLENCDASYFNANLHPAIMPYEIRIPGGHNNLNYSRQLPVSEFNVKLNNELNELELVHAPSNKRAYIFDMGFENHRRRSKLFQLLDKFTKAEYLSLYPLLSQVNLKYQYVERGIKHNVEILPRIVFDDILILQRKTWVILKEDIPLKNNQELDSEFYNRLNKWRKDCSIDEEVFVSISTNFTTNNQKPKVTLSIDDYKPQYIDFNNPLLVNLFEKIINKTPSRLRIQEVLPTPNNLIKIKNEGYAMEGVVQWYT